MCAQVCASRGYRFSNKHSHLYAPPRTLSDTSTHAPHQTSMGRKQPAREALSFRDARVYSGLSERESTTISPRSLFARAPVSSRKAPQQLLLRRYGAAPRWLSLCAGGSSKYSQRLLLHSPRRSPSVLLYSKQPEYGSGLVIWDPSGNEQVARARENGGGTEKGC